MKILAFLKKVSRFGVRHSPARAYGEGIGSLLLVLI